jgi:hypothetical protein
MARAGRCGYWNIKCQHVVLAQQICRGSEVVEVMCKNAEEMQPRIGKREYHCGQ